ncbi:hypothetical protein ElyMa_000134400 [Elysia marginata]|uniref:Uncharacterized protein n=1 Tax=Elysia marginata TaxID=1093978 RepID=A0AAV4EPQ9_9GAST|nr:hypothetical protein ElyMa_000134400 [Elysia marginata]
MRGNRAGAASSSSTSSSSLPRRGQALPSQLVPAAAAASPGESSSSSSVSDTTAAATKLGGPPLVLAPVSQINRSPRKNSRTEAALAAAEKATKFDPDYYNPDGSLRTMHKLPHFEQSYAQAMQARYIRHTKPIEREQELSVQQIFDKK